MKVLIEKRSFLGSIENRSRGRSGATVACDTSVSLGETGGERCCDCVTASAAACRTSCRAAPVCGMHEGGGRRGVWTGQTTRGGWFLQAFQARRARLFLFIQAHGEATSITAGATKTRLRRIRVSFDCDARNCAPRRARRPSRISDRVDRFYLSLEARGGLIADHGARHPTRNGARRGCERNRTTISAHAMPPRRRAVSRRTIGPVRKSRVRNRRAGTAGSHRPPAAAGGSRRTRSRSASAWSRAVPGRPSSSRS